MAQVSGFPPIANKQARVLILGSMPGLESLRQQQYYAHPRNSFWYIMSSLLGFDLSLPYEDRCQLLKLNKLAVWDVLQACYRPGSLDSAIDLKTARANDFESFLQAHPQVKTIFFNGGTAEQQFIRQVLPDLERLGLRLTYHRLPSTSPAHASMRPEQKLDAWRIVAETAGAA